MTLASQTHEIGKVNFTSMLLRVREHFDPPAVHHDLGWAMRIALSRKAQRVCRDLSTRNVVQIAMMDVIPNRRPSVQRVDSARERRWITDAVRFSHPSLYI